MESSHLAGAFQGNALKEEPYWQEQIAKLSLSQDDLPTTADVVVIGSGYTGLHTALQSVRAGRSTLVLEAGYPGQGCSTRNGGQISTSVKPSVAKLAARVGQKRARAIRHEGEFALNWIESFIEEENIDCDFQRNGRFHAAHSPRQYKQLANETDFLRRHENIEAHVVTQQEQRSELGTDIYYGGAVFPRHACLHAGKYHQGLLERVVDAGAIVVHQCTAQTLDRHSTAGANQITIKTNRGIVKARDVMIATNGYTTDLTPWLHQRIIPIGSYIIATEPLDLEQTKALFPTNRIVSDTCRVVYYYRLSPDRTRVLFGGRVSANETDPRESAPLLRRDMCRIFPQLRDTRITHSWVGTVAYTFDTLAHTGVNDGIYYAMGYCGSGVSMASYLGMRAGQKIVGDSSGVTAFDDLPFPSRPLYRGRPWFLPTVVSWYRWRDKLECKLAARQRSYS